MHHIIPSPLRGHIIPPHTSTRRTLYQPATHAQQVDGFTYERSAIEQWLKTHNTSPATGAELESKQLIPCHALRSLILEFQEAGV